MSIQTNKIQKSVILETIRDMANKRNLRSRTEFLVKLPKEYKLNISTLRRYMLELGIKKNEDGFYKLPDEVEQDLQRKAVNALFTNAKANIENIKNHNFAFISVKSGYTELLIHELRNHPILMDNIISMIPSLDGILIIAKDLAQLNAEIKKIQTINN